jgi:perosamine synthetase
MFRNHGFKTDWRQRKQEESWFYEMVALGYNYRLTDIGCALGLSQLNRLDANVHRRREISRIYSNELSSSGLILPAIEPEVEPVWHLYPVRIDRKKIKATRAEIFRAMRAENIGVNVHYIPVHLHPYYRERFGFRGGEYPVAEAAYESLISLPMFHSMSDRDVADVITAVRKVIAAFVV